ncbi:hypothetical protein P9112_009061 [Eukaryota sp. TZLM1-RC]
MSYIPPAKRAQMAAEQQQPTAPPAPSRSAPPRTSTPKSSSEDRFSALVEPSPPPEYRGHHRDNHRRHLPRSRSHTSFRTFHESEQEIFGDSVNTGINFDRYDDIPVETSANPPAPAPITLFTEIDLPHQLKWNVERAGFRKPTPVQKHSIPVALEKRDLMACAQTGSGKTAAFLIPCIADLLSSPPPPPSSSSSASPSVLVLAPTRELASQIHVECKKFAFKTGLRSVVVYGGAPQGPQLRELKFGCDILVATPGRLIDYCHRYRVSLANVQYFVLDEADRMLDMGFEPQIREIVDGYKMPDKFNRLTMMFSATFPEQIQRLAQDFLDSYVFLAIGRVGSTTDNITQRLELVPDREKKHMLMNLLADVPGRTLVFVETKRDADHLEIFLNENGYPATSIHGDRDQREREEALALFRKGETPVLVATDVASRGLDISDVVHVINYGGINNIDDYVHRIGRTGRAGNTGLATTFLNESDAGIFQKLKEILEDSGQIVPSWLIEMSRQSFRSGGSRRGGSRYGSKDFRRGGGRQQPNRGRWSGSFDY